MTETNLKTLLHDEASTPDFEPLDLRALTAAGDRRIRHRRWAGATGAVLGIAAVVAVPLALTGGAPETAKPEPAAPYAETRVTWATDSVIHYGDQSIDTGHRVDAFVHTHAGFVFASGGDVYALGGSEPERIGSIAARAPRLVVDEGTSQVGWADGSAYHVYDQDTGDAWSVNQAVTDPEFIALDDGAAYWRGPDGVEKVTRGSTPTPMPDRLRDVHDGVLAVATDSGTWVGTDEQHSVDLPQVYGEVGAFSPSARYYASDADDAQVFAVSTGDQVSFALSDYAFSVAYGWLDDGHVLVMASKTEKGPAQLLTCTVPAGACTAYGDPLGDFADLVGHFQLPTGGSITG